MGAIDGNSTLNWLTTKPTDISSGSRQNSKASPALSNSSDTFAKVFNDSAKKSAAAPKKPNYQNSEREVAKEQGVEESESSFERRPLPPGRSDRDFSKRGPDMVENRSNARTQQVGDRPAQAVKDPQARTLEKADESVDSLDKRQALQGLLKKMRDEFGIDAEQIVAAFASLTTQELQQPPEMTIDKVIQALPLDPQQQIMAKAVFQDMLKQTAVSGMADYLKGSHRQLSLEVLSRREATKRDIGRGIEKMQSQFFGPQAPVVAPLQQNISEATRAYNQQKPEGEKVVAPMMWQSAQPAISQDVSMMAPVMDSAPGIDFSQLGLEEVDPMSGESQSLYEQVATKIGGPSRAKLDMNIQTSAQEPISTPKDNSAPAFFQPSFTDKVNAELMSANSESQAAVSSSMSAAPGPIATPTPSATASAAYQAAIPMAPTSEGSDSREDLRDDSGSTYRGTELLQKAPGQSTVQAKESFVIPTQPNPTHESKNIREIVSQAQFLAQKGGGEMKVSLAPEGLGQVNMKVAVHAGQVSVEMVADSNDAKKVLERGIGELKSSLMAHNLKVDQIRVDLPSDISRHLGQQDDAQRQFAQQFLEQFRQDNREWRGGFTDITGAKAYRSQREDAETSPVPNSNNRRREGARRLDLVA